MNNVRLQKAKFEEVVTTYQNKVLSAAEEVENGVAQYLRSEEEVKFLHASVVEADKARDKGLIQFKAGKIDGNRLAVLAQNVVAQENLEAQAKGNSALGLIQIYRALGGGWQFPCDDCLHQQPVPDPGVLPAAADAPPTGVPVRFGAPR